MNAAFHHIPAGQRIPGSTHSVSVSVPDVASVIGFESQDPATLQRIPGGYPRFRRHSYVQRVLDLVARQAGVEPTDLVLTRSRRAAAVASAYAGLAEDSVFECGGVRGVCARGDPRRLRLAAEFVRHTGGHLSSREAEDVLYGAGVIGTRQVEDACIVAPEASIAAYLADAYGVPHAGLVTLYNSGMNAVAAAIAAVSEVQRPQGRSRWLQLGWIFFDTVSVLHKRLLGVDAIVLADPFNVDEIARAATAHAGELAGIVAEVPSNPLVQTPDLLALREIAARIGCGVVLDATIGTPHNVDVVPHCDVVCESLTKYATASVDVLMGAAVVNPSSPLAPALVKGIACHGDPPYTRDASRVAARIQGYRERMRRVNANTGALVDFFNDQDIVRRVHWAYEPRSAPNYAQVQRGPDSPGGLMLVDLRVPIEKVYDQLAVAKGPSFGGEFTMASAQIFIAHYDLLCTTAGRAALAERGLHRDMLRVSVGTEEPEQIAAVFEEAFRCAT